MNFASRRRRSRITEVNITPLIDVVFNLLIFFLITTTFVQNPGIDVDLPRATDAPVQPQADSVIIAVTANGRLIHEGRAISDDELEHRLREHHKVRQNAIVIIQADKATSHGKVVEVMDLARRVGFHDLAIATEAEQ
ncbi:ExbD/TolR family protein [Myxococcota bacterium]